MMERAAVALAACLFVAAAPGCTAKSAGPPAASPSDGAKRVDTAPLDEGDVAHVREAIKRMDAGKLDEAIGILEEVHVRHPAHVKVLHELALGYRLSRRPEKAVALLIPYQESLPDETLASLGSAFDEWGKGREAENLFRTGLAKHPDSGILFSELATTLRSVGRNDEAFALYERGMRAEPSFGPNYLHAAEMLEKSTRRGLTVIYGEMFRLLEPNTNRSSEAAKMMVRVLKNAVQIEKHGDETRGHITLAPVLEVRKPSDAGAAMPLVNRFELTFGLGLILAHRQDGLTLASLHAARASFLKLINESPEKWEGEPLFAWLRQVDRAGKLEAYDYWLYAPAFPPGEFLEWLKSHPASPREITQYLDAHPLFPAAR